MEMNLIEKTPVLKNIESCTHNSAILCKQLNCFTNSYALKYPNCCDLINCDNCPYSLRDNKNIDDLNQDEKKKWKSALEKFYITPENVLHKELDIEQTLKIFSDLFDDYRTPFRKEEERIIYTEAFRRLQYKTQVMINSASDDQRTRLLHSLEVQKISRKIAVALKANYELTDAIAIAHDIGHSPFGHAGERKIKLFLENEMAGSFSHALQSVKVIDFLCSHRALKPMGLRGLGISDLVLEGILKHDSDSFSDNMATSAFRLQYECDRLYKPVGANPAQYNDNEIYIGGIESQIVCWADKIAYMSHDWEEFVDVGLLEVMVSRINEIIIQMNDFIENSDKAKYEYLENIESENLNKINETFKNLKEHFYSDNYSHKFDNKNDLFVKKLTDLINILKETVELQQKHPNSFLLFSNEQYKIMHSFFSVAYAWIIITKVKPKDIGGKIDIIFVIYKYLCETTAHRTVPALIKTLIASCYHELYEFNIEGKSSEELIKYCNKLWEISKNTIKNSEYKSKLCSESKKRLKDELKKSFIVCFDPEYYNAVNCIGKFIHEEFIESTRVRFMTKKAEIIIGKLLKFYYSNYHMLPLKYRKRIELETSLSENINRIKYLLQQYYKEIIEEAIIEDECSGNNARFEHVKKLIIKKINSILQENIDDSKFDATNDEEKYQKFKNEVCNTIISNEAFAKDAIKLRIIADYISGMTDRMAEKKYNEICSSSTQWSRAFTERGTFNI